MGTGTGTGKISASTSLETLVSGDGGDVRESCDEVKDEPAVVDS